MKNKHITTQNGTAFLLGVLVIALFFIGYSSVKFDNSFKNITRIISTASQVAQVSSSLTDGLVAHYTFDEGSGTTAGDSVGGNNGTLVNGPTWTTGKVGSGALKFDGVDDYVSVPSSPYINFGANKDFSVSIWYYATKTGSGALISKRAGGGAGYLIYYNGLTSNASFNIVNSSSTPFGFSATNIGLIANSWNLITVTVSRSGNMVIYKNGFLFNEVSISSAAADNLSNSIPLQIGEWTAAGRPFGGFIDDVRIYNRALSSGEVQDLYTYTGSVVTPTPDTPPDPNPTVTQNYSLTVQKSGSGKGTVTGGSINCGSVCTQASISSGTNIILTANSSNDGSVFTGWSGDCSGTGTCSISFSKDTTVTANFDNSNIPSQNNTEWYVSPSGNYSNFGTINSPWDLQFALKGANGAIKPGHTVWIREGTYTGIDQINYANVLGKKFFISKLSGTEQAPIIVRNYNRERVTINGSIESSGPWTTFWGLEITNTDSTSRTGCPIDRQGGLTLLARGNKAINMIIHDTGHPGIGFWNPVGDGGELYGNIMWANGIYDICDGGTPQKPNTRGSGFYMQNNSGTRYVHDNISFWEFTTGMKAYGGNTDGFDFQGNVVFNNPYEGIFVTANGEVTKRLKLISNYTFQEKDKAAGNIGIGIYSPGVFDPGVDVVVQNNYFATGDIIPWPDKNGNYPAFALDIKDFSDVTVTGNKFIGGGLVGLLVTNRLTNLDWNNNAYYSTRIAHPNYPFYFQDARPSTIQRFSQFFSDWKKSCNCDGNSTYNTGLPLTNDIFVRPNKYEQGRAHIVVYNWQGLPSVKVDVSSILASGDTYEVRDAQNYFGTPATQGAYSGGEITLPMNLTAVSPVLGNIVINQTHTSSQFGAFVLIRTASGGGSPTPLYGSCSSVINQCEQGTFIDTEDSRTKYRWSCTGSNGGSSASCSLPISTSNQDIVIQNTLPTPQITDPITPTPPSSTTFTLTLTQSSPTIRLLQQTLNNKGYLVSTTGSGSKGNETTYFGQATLTALKKYQCTILKRCSGNLHGVLDQETATSLGITLTTTPVTTTTNKFTRSLTIGSTGQDVKNLQIFLNSKGYTVSTTGAGSKGQETTYFGPATQRALIKFQEAYRSEILTPNGLTRGTGYFGPSTMRKVNGI